MQRALRTVEKLTGRNVPMRRIVNRALRGGMLRGGAGGEMLKYLKELADVQALQKEKEKLSKENNELLKSAKVESYFTRLASDWEDTPSVPNCHDQLLLVERNYLNIPEFREEGDMQSNFVLKGSKSGTLDELYQQMRENKGQSYLLSAHIVHNDAYLNSVGKRSQYEQYEGLSAFHSFAVLHKEKDKSEVVLIDADSGLTGDSQQATVKLIRQFQNVDAFQRFVTDEWMHRTYKWLEASWSDNIIVYKFSNLDEAKGERIGKINEGEKKRATGGGALHNNHR